MAPVMTMNRFFRKSKEIPADEDIVATGAQQPQGAPQQESEANTINALLKATQGGLDTTAIRERRLSTGMVDPLKGKSCHVPTRMCNNAPCDSLRQ